RVDLCLWRILPGLIHSARQGEEPVVGGQHSADDPEFAANLERAISQDDANTGHLLSRLYLDPVARHHAVALDSRNHKVLCSRHRNIRLARPQPAYAKAAVCIDPGKAASARS